MTTDFIPYGVYEDIINMLGHWKILDMKSLSEMCNYDIKYFNLLKKVRKLESHGIIKGVLLGRKDKHIYLTNKGLRYTPYDFTYEICDENITHDLIVGRVLKELLKFSPFVDGRMYHQIMTDKIFPDAQVEGIKNNERYKLALEVELTQKSKERVKDKYRKYGQGESFNYALFVTNKESLFRTYKRYLEEMNRESREAVILMYDENLSATKFKYDKIKCYYMGEMTSFIELFSNENS